MGSGEGGAHPSAGWAVGGHHSLRVCNKLAVLPGVEAQGFHLLKPRLELEGGGAENLRGCRV